MALDSITIYHLLRELSPLLLGARVDKIHQPAKDEVHLFLRPAVSASFPGPFSDRLPQAPSYLTNSTLRLLLNASPISARLHLTDGAFRFGKAKLEPRKNPAAPMFCMILRKHLEGARLIALQQPDLERIVILVFQNYNERGDLQEYHLYLEIMGKHSNLILTDPQTGVILDGIRRYSHTLSRHREILPGRPYILPPAQDRIHDSLGEDLWISAFIKRSSDQLDRPVNKLLLNTFAGLSPELAQEIVVRADLEADATFDLCGEIDLSRIYRAYAELVLNRASQVLEPTIYFPVSAARDFPAAFSFIPYRQYDHFAVQSLPSLNEAVNIYYTARFLWQRTEATRGSLRRVVQDHCVHVAKKMAIYEDALLKAEQRLPAQKFGELLIANLYRIPDKATDITLEDYTAVPPDPGVTDLHGEEAIPCVTITLDPTLTPVANAQRYFRQYNKAKATLHKTAPLLAAAQEEFAYLQSLLVSIDRLAQTSKELDEIYSELVEANYIAGRTADETKTARRGQAARSPAALASAKGAKTRGQSGSPANKQSKKGGKSRTPAEPPSRPHIYLSSTGRRIIVGRNNKQNDRLTWRVSQPHDLWLHVKGIPGSHVVVPLAKNEDLPDDATLLEAATLAIHFSQAAGSSHVPVDYTHVSQIKKPKGAKPGMVIYKQNRTLSLTPDPTILQMLLAREVDEGDSVL